MAPEELNLEDGKISESIGEASEEDMQRVREDMGKAKKVRTQIKQIQQQNKQFADMLSLLLQLIHDDELLWYIFGQLIEHKVSPPAIFAQFLPYLQSRIDTETYKNIYGALREQIPTDHTVVTLVAWLKQVRGSSKSMQAITIEEYTPFVLAYLRWMELIDLTALDPQKKAELLKSINLELAK